MPAKLMSCVEDVKKQGKSESEAFTICIESTGQKPHKADLCERLTKLARKMLEQGYSEQALLLTRFTHYAESVKYVTFLEEPKVGQRVRYLSGDIELITKPLVTVEGTPEQKVRAIGTDDVIYEGSIQGNQSVQATIKYAKTPWGKEKFYRCVQHVIDGGVEPREGQTKQQAAQAICGAVMWESSKKKKSTLERLIQINAKLHQKGCGCDVTDPLEELIQKIKEIDNWQLADSNHYFWSSDYQKDPYGGKFQDRGY